MAKYIALDGTECSSIADLMKINGQIKNHPLYIKEMKRRRIMNIPGEITRDQWAVIIGKVAPVVIEGAVDKEVKSQKFVKDMDGLVQGKVVKKTYKFQISAIHRSLLKSANRRGIPFDLNGEQIDSILEKKCYYCGKKSETIITLGERFEYKDCQGVCETCGEVHDLLGAGMTPWLDSIIENVSKALHIHAVVEQSEQLVCPNCKSENIIESFPHHNRYTCFDCKTEWEK